MTPRILIIAGSDSGGGAGIQADIKTVTMLGGHAMTAVTAITAQNTLGVQAVMPVPAEMVIAQIDSCVSDIGVDAVKIGMIGSADTANAVADWLENLCSRERGNTGWAPAFAGAQEALPIVFDPVMVATSGSTLADADTIAAFSRLMALATLVTPNLSELEALIATLSSVRPERVEGLPFSTLLDKKGSASTGSERTGEERLADTFETNLLVKGGHGAGDMLVDRLVDRTGEIARWASPRIDTTSTHGTGCTLGSAIATFLAEGRSLRASVARARQFVRLALHDAPGLGGGHGPMSHPSVRLDLGPEMRLNQITLGMNDPAASRDFYARLGLKQIVATPDGHYARFEAPGGATLSIEHAAEPTVFFECNDLDAEVARLQAKGMVFEHLPVDQEWLWREARLRDPVGNVICLYQADENRRYPPWRLR